MFGSPSILSRLQTKLGSAEASLIDAQEALDKATAEVAYCEARIARLRPQLAARQEGKSISTSEVIDK